MDKRTAYWNEEYVKYWKAKVEETTDKSAEGVTKGDVKTVGDDVIYAEFDRLGYAEGDKLLDYGCGFGRFYEYFRDKKQDYFGMDISQAMIDETVKRYPELKDKVQVSEGEHLPYQDESFDKIICQGVFDACYQNQALSEMLRVAKLGGCLYITGKNNNYFDDDELALVAERNARRKGHPNFFTDVHKMRQMLLDMGDTILSEEYTLRRGDWVEQREVGKIPEKFYEWRLYIRKDSKFDSTTGLPVFSDAYSETWKRVGMAD